MNDEDIKIVEELVCQKYSERLLNTLSMAKEEDEVYILTINERQAIENLLSRLKTAERMIELMAKFMNKRSWKEHQVKDDTCYCCKTEYGSDECEQCIIEYFRNKAKESE